MARTCGDCCGTGNDLTARSGGSCPQCGGRGQIDDGTDNNADDDCRDCGGTGLDYITDGGGSCPSCVNGKRI